MAKPIVPGQTHCIRCQVCFNCTKPGVPASDGKKVCTSCKDAYEKALIENEKRLSQTKQ